MPVRFCQFFVLLLIACNTGSAFADSTITVQTTALEISEANPFGVENGVCALDEALGGLNGFSTLDCAPQVSGASSPLVINLEAGVYSLTGSLPKISDNTASVIQINGNGATIERSGQASEQFQLLRAFTVKAGYKLSLRDLNFRNAEYLGVAGALSVSGWDLDLINATFENNHAMGQNIGQGQGGALSVTNSHIYIHNCRFLNNRADRTAGAVYLYEVSGSISATAFLSNQASIAGALWISRSEITVSRSQFVNNESSGHGGAISAEYSSQPANNITINASIFRNNTAGSGGGAIRSNATSTAIRSSLFQGNSALTGGAIMRGLPTGSSYQISNSTFTQNSARSGGAIAIEHGLMVLTGSTIVANSANRTGGGIWLDDTPTAQATIDHSIILANGSRSGPADCAATNVQRNGGGNSILGYCGFPLLIGDRSVDISLVALEEILQPLANNGGNTKTFEPTESGFAHNKGNRAFIPTVGFDQRSYPRIAEGRVDIGAHERSAEQIQGMLDVVFNSSLESSEPWRYVDRQEFLADTMADDATGALPQLGNLNNDNNPINVGTVTFVRYPNSSFFFDDFSAAIPDSPVVSDTIDLALNSLEQFDIRTNLPVKGFGFDFVDPDADGTKFNLLACASEFDPVTENCPQQDIVFSMDFSSDNAARRFFGFALVDTFVQVSIRELTNSNTNEYFGHFYTVPD